MIRTLLALPFRIVAVLVAVPTRLSARLLRFSAVTTLRTTRAAVRSSIVSFLLGVGLGWFLTTPTGRYATGVVLDAVRGRTTPPADDPALAEQVRTAVSTDPHTVDLPLPHVSVTGGVATLRGVVPDATAREHLTRTAAQVAGIVSVVDAMSVEAPAPSA